MHVRNIAKEKIENAHSFDNFCKNSIARKREYEYN